MSLTPEILENPLLGGLPPVERAKLLADVEERDYAPGEVIFRAGSPGDALYLLLAGSVAVHTGPPGAEALVGVLRAPDYFGEQALLTGDPRSTTVIAVEPVRVARLPKARFEALLARNPELALYLGRVLSRRLAGARRALSELRHGFEELAAARLAAAPPDQRRFLTQTAILRRLEPAVVDALLETEDAAAQLAALEREGVVSRDPDGVYGYPPLRARFLRDRLRADIGESGVRRLHERAAQVWAARGEWAEAAYHSRAAGQPEMAERVLYEAGRTLLGAAAPDPAVLRRWLAALDAAEPLGWPLRCLQLDALRRLGDAAGERRALEAAVAVRARPLTPDQLARCYGRLADLAAADDPAAAARWLGLALAFERGASAAESAEPPPLPAGARDGSPGLGQLTLAADRAFGRAVAATRGLGGPWGRRGGGLLLAALVTGLFTGLPPPADLSPAAWLGLAVLAVFVPVLVFEVVPDYVAALLLAAAWVMLGVVPARVAFGGYATGTWLLVLAVLGLGAAVARCGLLYRVALLALTHLPATHMAQGLALATLGIGFTPAMPNATARTAMAAPLAVGMADALGYPPRSAARAGLALAALFGFGQLATLFLTGSSTGLLVHGLLPPDVREQFTWSAWLLAALPLHLVVLLFGLGAALIVYRPRAARAVVPERVALQWRLLGPLSRDERITLAVLALVLGGFLTQPLHHVDPAWVGLLGFCTLLATGALDQATLRGGVNWSFLLYLGVLIAVGDVFVQLGLDAWFARQLAALLTPLAGSVTQFVLALALACFALSFVLRWQVAAVLVTLVLGPVAAALGISPWVVGIVALTATNVWFLPYQSTIYLALYYGMNETWEHRQVRPVAWAYALAVLAGVALSVPYWRALGLVP